MTDDSFEPRGEDATPPGEAANSLPESTGDHLTGRSEGPAVSGRPTVGVMWQEGAPGHWVIKLSGLPGAPPGQEVTLGRPGASNHSPSVSDQPSPAGHVSRISIAWIESPPGDTSGIGRVMWQNVGVSTVGKPIDPDAVAAAANDNATWVTDLGGAGVLGCEPDVTALTTGDTLVTWIGVDGHAHGRLYGPADPHAASQVGDGSDDPEHAAVNAVLGDLGPVGAAPDAGRRLQVAELRPGTFAVMWLALGESGPVLRGSLFLPSTGAEHSGDQGGWTDHAIPEVRLPRGFAGPFSVAPAGQDGADLSVTYTGPAGATTVNAFGRHLADVLGERHVDDVLGVGHLGEVSTLDLVDLGAAAGQNETWRAHVAHEHAAAPGLHPPPDEYQPQTPASLNIDHEWPAVTDVAVAANPGIIETAPIVQTVPEGFAVAWQSAGGTDETLQIKLTLYGQDGVPKSPEILVADSAAADVAPAISGLGDGAAAAYVHAGDGTLVVKAYAADGTQIGQEAVVDPDGHVIVEIAVGSNAEDELAVVYVQQSSDAGEIATNYGSIMLQRYALAAAGSQSGLVALGRDGKQDDADGAVQLTTEGDGPDAAEQAVGRAPAAAGVDHGELAIIWVESDGTRETIRGLVLDQDGGQALRIDLTDLLESAGIAKGTKPTLLDTGDGDFLVSWLQPDGDDGGYVVMTAFYSEVGPGLWLAPEQAVRLQEFDDEPKDYAVALSSDDDELFINVIWRQDSSGPGSGNKVYSQRYDIDGQRVGGALQLDKHDAPSGDQQPASNSVAAAGLLDGQVIVVYAEQGSNGDLDLAAHIIDTSGAGDTVSSNKTSSATDIAGGNTFSTTVDLETAIDVLANDMGAGLTISRINDVPITTETPVDVGYGWVQLREDGGLTVTPDAGYTGQIAFDYTVAGTAAGIDSKGHVVVNVEADEAPAAVTLLNQVIAIPEDVSTAVDLKVADIAVVDGEPATDGLSLTGLDASMFKIVGNALYLKEGIELDFDTKPTLSVAILASRDGELDGAASFSLNVESASEAPALDATSDTFVFAPGYVGTGGEHQVIDLSATGYATFQELVDSGALVQAGDDVVITLDPGDPTDPYRITLKGVDLSALGDSDFKFS